MPDRLVRRAPRLRQRALAAGLTAAATLAVAAPAYADLPGDGAAGVLWPDGSYSVIVRGSAGGSGSSAVASNVTASATLDGRFSMTLDGGAVDGRADAHLLYLGWGSGTSSGGVTGSGSAELSMTGYAVADGGVVAVHREQAVVTITVEGVTLPPQTHPLNDEFELIVTSSSCGLVEGRMLGTFEGLDAVSYGFFPAGLQAVSDFLAVSDDLTGDADAWITTTAQIVDEITELDRRMAAGELTVAETLVALRPLVADAESLTTAFTAADCPPPDGFGIGVGSRLSLLLLAAIDLVETPLDLGRIAQLAAEAGVVDAEFSQNLLDAANELYDEMVNEEVDWDPGDLLQLATTAGIAGDTEFAETLFQHYLDEAE